MDFDGTNVIIEKNVEHLGADSMTDYVAHVYVYHGNCQMKYHEEPLMLDAGQCMIVRMQRLLTDVSPSPDFQGTVIYIKPVFIEMSTPRNNYGIRGSLLLFINPVMQLDEQEQQRCRRNFEEVEERLNSQHPFKHDVVSCACQLMFLDFFQFHKRLYPGDHLPFQNAKLMSDFFQMLFRGDSGPTTGLTGSQSLIYSVCYGIAACPCSRLPMISVSPPWHTSAALCRISWALLPALTGSRLSL